MPLLAAFIRSGNLSSLPPPPPPVERKGEKMGCSLPLLGLLNFNANVRLRRRINGSLALTLHFFFARRRPVFLLSHHNE